MDNYVYCVLKPVINLKKNCFLAWYGVLFVHKGYYKNGVFKFKLNIPSEYPFSLVLLDN